MDQPITLSSYNNIESPHSVHTTVSLVIIQCKDGKGCSVSDSVISIPTVLCTDWNSTM